MSTQAVEKDAYRSLYETTVAAPPGITLDNIQPHPKYILCRVIPKDEMTEGGIHLPEKSQTDKAYAVVLKVPGVPLKDAAQMPYEFPIFVRPLDIEPGDLVFFRMAYGPSLTLGDGTEIVFLRCWGEANDDIIAVFKGNTLTTADDSV